MILAFIVLAVVLVMMVKGLSDPFMAMFAFITVYELQPGELYPALNVLHLERVLLVFIVIALLMTRTTLRFPPITKKFLAFFAAMVLSIPFSFWIANTIQQDISFFETVVYCILLVSLLLSPEKIKKYLLLFTGLTAWIGASSLYEYHVGVRQFQMGIERAEGLTSAGGDPDTLATSMIICMPFAFAMMARGNSKRVRAYGLLLFAVYIITVIDTGSRTAFLAFLFFLLMMMFQRRSNLKYLPVLLIALPLFWLVIPAQYKARYESIKTRDQDESYTNRLLSWQGGVQMFLHNPVTGVGTGNYAYANGMKYWPGSPRHWLNAHSLYFKLLGELGILGILTFTIYVVSLIRLNRFLARRFRKEKIDPLVQRFPLACNLAIYLLLFTGYSAHNLYRSTWFTFGAVSGAMALLQLTKTKAEKEPAADQRPLPAWTPRNVPQAELEPETLPA
jgi:O-antigen ligase